MAQTGIREYDVKRMLASYLGTTYTGSLVTSPEEIDTAALPAGPLVVKPDQLFGKRGKHGLVGVRLSDAETRDWMRARMGASVTVGSTAGTLSTFLVEPFVAHEAEYFVAIRTTRTHDELLWSERGGIDVEESWEHVRTIPVGVLQELDAGMLAEHGIHDPVVTGFLLDLMRFFRLYGFAYLEINPFTIVDGLAVCLDAVGKVDTCEAYRQTERWWGVPFPHAFGVERTPAELYIDELDAKTGASLKLRILNPEGRFWLLTSGGGASVIIADTLADLGHGADIGNYGECSGNPDRENTREYARTLIDEMLRSPASGKHLVIAGAIANFTHVDKTFLGIIDALRLRHEELRAQGVRILVRRGGINDRKGLAMMKDAWDELGIPMEIAGSDRYMTDILASITSV